MKIVILIYDNEQVKRVGQVIREHQNKQNEVLVVALRADVEITLKEVGIPFISSREFRSVDPVERYAFSEELVTPLFHSKKFDFWSFQNIDFQTLYQPLLQTYLAELLYWIDMIDGIMATHAPQRIVTWDSANIAAIGNVLSVKNSKVVTDAVFVVSNQKSISCDIRSVGNVFVLHNTMFRFKRLLFIFSIFIWNFAITVFKKPKSVRLIVSDIWRNSAPYIKEIPEAEVVVWDRSEIKNINFSTLLKNRMRFFHANTFRTYKSKKQAQRQIILLNNQWIKERDDFFKKMGYSYYQLEHNGHLMPVLNISCQYLKSAKYDEPVLLRSTLEKFKGARLSFRYELIREADLKLLSVAKIEYSITNRAYQPINIKKTNQELWEKLNNCFN